MTTARIFIELIGLLTTGYKINNSPPETSTLKRELSYRLFVWLLITSRKHYRN